MKLAQLLTIMKVFLMNSRSEKMNLEITEEERNFLERVCTRAELFVRLQISSPNNAYSDFSEDLQAIKKLIIKLDSHSINKNMEK